MAVETLDNIMLYCPKCQQTYEEGSQRFCTNEGERLLISPASSGKNSKYTEGVFTSILNRKNGSDDDKFSNPPRFPKASSTKYSPPSFRPPTDSKIFAAEQDDLLELDLPPIKPVSAFIKTDDIPLKITRSRENETEKDASLEQIKIGAKKNFAGRVINERFNILEELESNEKSVVLLAEDTLINGKKVLVKIFSGDENDSFAERIYAEERSSLRQINHPNVAAMIDEGKLDGKLFIVTERVEGKSVKEYLSKNGHFNVLRAARIVRQAAEALSAVHENGVLHRNLKPENIILSIDETGKEQVKLTNFGEAGDELNQDNLLYKSPEQVEGKVANFTSDGFSLAVIGYQMLTNRLPFSAVSVGDLLKAQREGLKIYPTSLRTDLSATVDRVLEKALAFNSFDRYPKVIDFGEEFFEAATADLKNADAEAETAKPENSLSGALPLPVDNKEEKEEEVVESTPIVSDADTYKIDSETVKTDKNVAEEVSAEEDEDLIRSVKATEDLAWEKRSPKPLDQAHPNRAMLSLIGVAILLAALIGVWYYFINRPNDNQILIQLPVENVNQNAAVVDNSQPATVAPTPEEIESPPLPRQISQPPNTIYFQNSRENLKGDALRNFLGFSLYYPKDWKLNQMVEDGKDGKARTRFLDISNNASSGTPIEQLLVGYYNSRGTFKTDQGVFPTLVKETNQTLQKIVPNYQMVAEGKKTINNGWQAYEVSFQGTGKTANGENIKLWGKRLFIPTAVRGMKNGYVVTMLATSLSKDVKSVDDVGVKGELSAILETFEPNQTF